MSDESQSTQPADTQTAQNAQNAQKSPQQGSKKPAVPAKKGKEPRRRLGRGLSSLIANSTATGDDREYQHVTGLPPVAEADTEQPHGKKTIAVDQGGQSRGESASAGPCELPIDGIAANPYQPRRTFSEDQLRELADSIAAQGILQPLVVAENDNGEVGRPYVLIAGERRLRAARQAGLQTVPCVVRQATRRQMLEWALVENIHREDLNPVERAAAYRDYIDRFDLSQAAAAERLGQPRATVANYLRIIDLPEGPQQMLVDGALTFGHAKVLAGLAGDPQQQTALAKKVAADGLSVRQLEGMIAAIATAGGDGETAQRRQRTSKPPYIRDLEEQLTHVVGTRVTIKPGRAKNTGRLVIDYYDLDDFDRIASMLGFTGQG